MAMHVADLSPPPRARDKTISGKFADEMQVASPTYGNYCDHVLHELITRFSGSKSIKPIVYQ